MAPIDLDTPGPAAIEGGIRRDRWGRPYIVTPDGAREKAYTRCTTYVGVLEDLWNLQQWEKRQVALGLAGRPDLLLAVAANANDKKALNTLTDRAMEAANSHSARDTGTALHKLCERWDLGDLDLNTVPPAYRPDVEAYVRATRGWVNVHIEQMMVRDDLEVAGTPDRIVEIGGRRYIADLKTGSSMEHGQLKICMQLAMYSRSELYDPQSGDRTPVDVKQDRGIVLHLPAGSGTLTPYWVDLDAGWDAIQTARDVRAWRKRKGLFTPYVEATPVLFEDARVGLVDEIRAASTEDELTAIWARASAAGAWTAEHTTAAQQRKGEIGVFRLIGIASNIDELRILWENADAVGMWTAEHTKAAQARANRFRTAEVKA